MRFWSAADNNDATQTLSRTLNSFSLSRVRMNKSTNVLEPRRILNCWSPRLIPSSTYISRVTNDAWDSKPHPMPHCRVLPLSICSESLMTTATTVFPQCWLQKGNVVVANHRYKYRQSKIMPQWLNFYTLWSIHWHIFKMAHIKLAIYFVNRTVKMCTKHSPSRSQIVTVKTQMTEFVCFVYDMHNAD